MVGGGGGNGVAKFPHIQHFVGVRVLNLEMVMTLMLGLRLWDGAQGGVGTPVGLLQRSRLFLGMGTDGVLSEGFRSTPVYMASRTVSSIVRGKFCSCSSFYVWTGA